jgi:hypothetical protein
MVEMKSLKHSVTPLAAVHESAVGTSRQFRLWP